ncbi:unnamed protein product [Tenebrio molitor]|nr:unnamed protein product [Tenebrio molitor]
MITIPAVIYCFCINCGVISFPDGVRICQGKKRKLKRKRFL